MIILDTNVISELVRREPSSVVLKKVRSFLSDDLYTTVITEAEIRLGLAILPRGKKRTALQMQVDPAQAYAKLVAARRTAGRPMSLFDAQIAAIVQARGAVLVTRNTSDFQGCQFDVINPWG